MAMLAVGMELNVEQFRVLFREPRIPVVGTIIHSLTFPLIAVTAILGLQTLGIALVEATIIGVLLIAACPSGGFSNILTLMARANLPLSIVLTAVSSIFSFLTVPLLLGGFGLMVSALQGSIELPVAQILLQLLALVLAPVGLGMWLSTTFNWLNPTKITQSQKWTQLALYVVVALMIIENWQVMVSGFVSALPWSIGLCVTNIWACFFLARKFRLKQDDAITVSLEGSVRNLGVAFLIAANTLDRIDIAVLPTVYFLTVLVVSILFAKNWRLLPGFNAQH